MDLQDFALMATILSGAVTAGGALFTACVVFSNRFRRWTLERLGIPALHADLDQIKDDVKETRQTQEVLVAQVLALAYAIEKEGDQEVELLLEKFIYDEAAADHDGDVRASDFLDGINILTRGD